MSKQARGQADWFVLMSSMILEIDRPRYKTVEPVVLSLSQSIRTISIIKLAIHQSNPSHPTSGALTLVL